ncbi:NUDIX domain-containing protein [Undibacterium sp. RuTC16W]|uniref:NUDIX domain-containing protein n=1 Tax=Undibacterium sp. RuTC16W TaxID=3413048 RepID=UPI003BEFE9FF
MIETTVLTDTKSLKQSTMPLISIDITILPQPDFSDMPIDPTLLQTRRPEFQHYFGDTLEFIAFLTIAPSIKITGHTSLSAAELAASRQHATRLAAINRPDDPHLIVTSALSNTSCLEVEEINFSGICSLRDQSQQPAILSASALLVCEETQELILHRRSESVVTHPNHWHVIGGAMHPQLDLDQGQLNLLKTIQREVQEETELTIELDDIPLLSLVKESSNGFIQCAAIGIGISAKTLDDIHDNWEGHTVRVPFTNLATCLREPLWVPSGKAHVLTWLALRAMRQAQGDGQLQENSQFNPEELLTQILRE